jgi:hypothetical protein
MASDQLRYRLTSADIFDEFIHVCAVRPSIIKPIFETDGRSGDEQDQ